MSQPLLLSGVTVSIGNRYSDASSQPTGINDSTPFMSWTLPAGVTQQRFQIVINNVDPTAALGYTVRQSGIQVSTAQQYDLPENLQLDETFYGVCMVTVQLSSSQDPEADMESVSAPSYFVYDPKIDSLYRTPDVQISWTQVADPDNGPSPLSYQYQISRDPQFVNYNVLLGTVAAPTSGRGLVNVPTGVFVPALDQWYFFRVRAYDGLDYGEWSAVNAFISRSTVTSSTFTIDDVRIVGDGAATRSIDIAFTINDTTDQFYRVQFTYQGLDQRYTSIPIADQPLCLLDPVHRIQGGSHVVRWVTAQQLGNNKVTLTLTGTAYPATSNPISVQYGPMLIDNTEASSTSGGSPTSFTFPVYLGSVQVNDTTISSYLDADPVVIEFGPDPTPATAEVCPVSRGGYLWRNTYVIGRIEEVLDSGSAQGRVGFTSIADSGQKWWFYSEQDQQWETEGYSRQFYPSDLRSWPGPIACTNLAGGNTWQQMASMSGRMLGQYLCKTIAVDTIKGFLFYAPRDDSLVTTIPTPHTSGQGNKMARCLTGYYDLNGVAQTYPNGYDWDTRPMWHNGREIYGENDAWVQVISIHWTHYDMCQTCKGLNYVVQGTQAPYQRVQCPNPTCVNGFDQQLPLYTFLSEKDSLGQPLKNPIVKNYLEVSWERFSRWYNVDWTWNDRRGLTASSKPFATKKVHIYGRGLDSVERVYGTTANPDGTFPIIGHNITINGYTSMMPISPFSFERWDFSSVPNITGPVSRQENELPVPTLYIDVEGYNLTSGSIADYYPVETSFASATKYLDTEPAVIEFGPDPTQFWLGGPDPSDPLSYRRPPTTEWGDLAATVSFQTRNITLTNTFRFLNVTPMWDAFTTIHWQHNESDTTSCQTQYRSTASVNESDWKDIQALNGTYNTLLNRWLTPPHCNYAYWDTEDPVAFPDGSTFYLRLRTTDTSSSIDSPWVYSTMVSISHGITNPVNVMSTVYEPWSKEVTITVRCDDTQSDAYTLTRYWYTVDPLADNPQVTWNEISSGDISGETVGLSSTPGDNDHVIIWDTEPYGLGGSPRYRLMIQCIPTGLLQNVTVPFLKFLTPMNPYIDAAQADYNSIMGVMVTQVYSSTDNAYVPADPVYYQTGNLVASQQEMIQVKSDPPAGSGDSPGWYAFYTPTPAGSVWADLQAPGYNSSAPGNSPLNTGYTLTDPTGLAGWMSSKYDATETHGQAMQRVAATINSYLTVSIPGDTATISAGEIDIRKTLIAQGYYAEDHFIAGGANGGVKEWVEVAPVSNVTGNALSTQIGRQWRFRVQNVAADGDSVFVDGVYDPTEITPLEQVYYKVELDYTQTYDSQPYGRPLRRFITDPQGNRLSIAEPYTGVGFNGEANAGSAPVSSQSGVTSSSPPINVAGVLKIVPMLLPGQVTTAVLTAAAATGGTPLPQVMPNQAADRFATGQTSWTAPYYWRVCAYNYVVAPIAAIPRPLITTAALTASTVNVTYTSQAHEDIQQSSLNYDSYYGTVYGYRVSDSFLPATAWMGVAGVDDVTPRTEIDWVSDIRADPTDQSRKLNFVPWVPKGTDRPHPNVFYDTTQQQYMWFMTKANFNGQPRIMGGRSMALPKGCEYTVYFGDEAYTSIWGPCCFADATAGGYRMYVCVDPGGGYPTQLCMTTSPDADAWTGLEIIETQGFGIGFDVKNACVIYDTNASPVPLYRMWYERTDGGMRKIFYATSTDGINFVAGNGDKPVYFDMVNVMSPTVIYLNSSWVMYYHDGDGCIASVVSPDGIAWTGKHYEMAPATITLDGSSLAVTYANPCVFLDRFYGNQELLMAYNVVKPTGENITHVSRLESRVWRTGAVGGISGATLDVAFTRDGSTNANTVTINSSANSIVPSANVKVRLWFDTITPDTAEFHRQSDWVDLNNETDVGGYMDPVPYNYDETLLQYPYMSLYSTTTNTSSGSTS